MSNKLHLKRPKFAPGGVDDVGLSDLFVMCHHEERFDKLWSYSSRPVFSRIPLWCANGSFWLQSRRPHFLLSPKRLEDNFKGR